MESVQIANALLSGCAELLHKDGSIYLAIKVADILDHKISVVCKNEGLSEETILTPCAETPCEQSSNHPVLRITPDIQSFYASNNIPERQMHHEVFEYLERVAAMWSSGNRTANAVTGSLIGKVSKSFTQLNERLFSKVGGEVRDAYLKELIKCNIPILESFWVKNS